MRARARLAAITALSMTAGLAGCGSSAAPGNRIPGRILTVYSSGPLHGPLAASAAAVLAGERLALAGQHARIGRYRIQLRVLDDSNPQRDGWDPGQTAIGARVVSADATAIGYLGDLESGASAVAIPVLNRVGIVAISPAATAIGLTTTSPAASPGEPEKYYPTGVRNFARVMPSDAVQAAVQARIQLAAGCRRTGVVEDGGVDGEEMAVSFQLAAHRVGLAVTPLEQFEPGQPDYRAFAQGVAATGVDCLLISADPTPSTALVARALGAAAPRARMFATSGLAEPGFTSTGSGGLPRRLARRVLLTAPAPPEGPVASELGASLAANGEAQPEAIYGYEAMSLLLNAISRATDGGRLPAQRNQVRVAVFTTRERRSPVGTYAIEPDGNTTQRRYGVYRISEGTIRLWRVMYG